jgi:hypothetical protein
LFDLSAGCDAVDVRHEDIHENQVDIYWDAVVIGLESCECGLCGMGCHDISVTGLGQHRPEQLVLIRRVIDNENSHRACPDDLV